MPEERRRLLPRDLYGRIACMLIGITLGIPAAGFLVVMIRAPRQRWELWWLYELTIAFALLGWSLLIWGILRPSWIERIADVVMGHLVSCIFLLFVPFAITAVATLLSWRI